MSADDIKGNIRSFLVARVSRAQDVGDGDDLFKSALINSMFAMQLLMYVEKTWKISVGPEDMNLDNFRSIDAIAGFVSRKLAA
jgi:acyl carrier protein